MSLLTRPRFDLQALATDMVVDFAIVGAGVAGVSAATLLKPLGFTVLLLDADAPGTGMTHRSTAHIANAVDGGWRKLVPRLGVTDARLAASAYAAGIAEVDRLHRAEGIHCDFAYVDGYLVGTPNEADDLSEERAAAETAGIKTAWLPHSPLPGDPTVRGLCFPGQARLHPVKYIDGLLARFLGRGGLVRRARVLSAHGGAPARVVTAAGPVVTARQGVVLANNAQIAYSKAPPQTLYTSYTLAGKIGKGSVADAVMWDLADPYHYIRLQPCADHDLVIIGGEDHAAAAAVDPQARLATLEAWARRAFPALGEITARWSGNIKQTADNLAYCGAWPGAQTIFVMDGDGGLGFNHATLGALIIRDATQGTPPPWGRLFDPARNGVGKHPLIPG